MISDPNKRKWVYGVTIAALPILVTFGILDDRTLPLWIALAAAIFAPAMAMKNVGPSIDETARDEDFTAEDIDG